MRSHAYESLMLGAIFYILCTVQVWFRIQIFFRGIVTPYVSTTVVAPTEDARPSRFHLHVHVVFFCFFLIVCFTSYFVFSIAVLPHSPGVVYYHLLLRRETRIPGVAPFSFRIGIWDLFVHRGQKSYTPTAFGKLWTTPGVRCMKHASS